MTFLDILSEYHIIPQFPPSVVKWTESAPDKVCDADLTGRTDLTDSLIITIDGDDAKDFDDAVSLEVLENGNYALGVHIADVTHYVTDASPVDRAAYLRGTSVYLIDTVIPMLPVELSNELCSLKPGEVRLTVSVFMEISKKGKVENYKICKSYIKSRERMTYNDVTRILEGDIQLSAKYQHLVTMLEQMRQLASILNKKRVDAGSIEFETSESKITMDRKGVPVKVEKYPISISNNIIEEFMLIANVTVAKYFSEKGLPCVYRVHESPDFDRIERLAKVLPELGVDFRFKADMQPKDFQKILDSVSSLDVSGIVNYLVLRTMSRARYSEKNLGHFGLSFSNYCHFTSPIRRYPDLAVHRILKESLKGEIPQNRISYFKELVISASVNSSITEANAADAELKWKDIKKAEYMTKHLGEKYKATITHITASGFFAELENTVEGFVAARTIEDDIYMMTDSGLALEGMRTKRRFTVGDSIEVKAVAADPGEGKIDFEVIGTSTPKFQKRKSSKISKNKKTLTREEKQTLRKFKSEYREERQKRSDSRQKADSERYIYENAVVYELFELLKKMHRFTKSEQGYVGVTLKDLAAITAQPIYRKFVFDTDEIGIKNALIAASRNVQNTLASIFDSFDIKPDAEAAQFATEYVCSALRHLDFCMRGEDINFAKREHEYDNIMRKLKNKGRVKE